jgi:putative copper export protein
MGVLEDLRSVAYALARFTGFASNAFLFGLVPVTLLVLRPSFRGLDGAQWARGRARVAGRLEGFAQAALIASASATAIALLLQALLVAQIRREPLDMASFTSSLETSFGQWYLLRFPLLAGLAVVIVGKIRRALLRGAGDGEASPGRTWWVAWLAFGAALLATSTFSGHASVAEPRAVALLNDLVHLVAGSIWFAGIVILAVVLPDGWAGKGRARLDLLAPAVLRFSKVAIVAIAIVGATGTVNSLLDVGAFNDLVDTAYGRIVASKIALFLIVLVLGGVNHFFLRARLERARADGSSSTAPSLFRRTIAAELVVALGLMGLSGVLVGQARTKDEVVGTPPGPGPDAGARSSSGVSSLRRP